MKITRPRLKRSAALAGIVGASVTAALLVPASAQAATPIGSEPGHLTFTPASGPTATKPNWATTDGCPTGFTTSAVLRIVKDDGTTASFSTVQNSATVDLTAPFSGTTLGTFAAAENTFKMVGGHTYEFVVFCFNGPGATGDDETVQSTFLTLSADAASYTTSDAPPAAGSTAVATSTTLVADPTTADAGASVALTATVAAQDTAGNDAAGQVEFFNGSTSLGTEPVSQGTASMSVSTLPAGDNSITAKFEPTDATAFAASTSAAVTVTVNQGTTTPPAQGGSGTETINVNVPQVAGDLTLSVDNTPVQLSQATNNGTVLDSTGSLSPITVGDARIPLAGWDLTGSVTNFASGTNQIPASDLGWTPKVTTPNTAGDVTAGGTVAPSSPGLGSTPAELAAADAGKGGGTTVLGADLDLQAPVDTPAGDYSATLTVTLMSK